MRYIAFILTVLLVSCVNVPDQTGPKLSELDLPAKKDGFGIVYVYRWYAPPDNAPINIYVDKELTHIAADLSFTRFYVPVGSRQIKAEWTSGWTGKPLFSRSVDIEVAEGETYYFELDGDYTCPPQGCGELTVRYKGNLKRKTNDGVEKSIEKCCRYGAPQNGAI